MSSKIRIIILAIITITTACSSPSDKARSLIEKDLKNSSINWLSYQFEEISEIDTLYSIPTDDKQFAMWCQVRDSLEFTNSNPPAARHFNNLIQAYEQHFKKQPIGWTCKFKFSSENKYGERYTSTYYYSFDKKFTRIIDQADITPPQDKQPSF